MTELALPGLGADPIATATRSDDYPLWHPMTMMSRYRATGLCIVGGEGSRVRDEDGRSYLAAAGGLWNVCCGFRHPRILDAIRRQLDLLPYSTLYRYGHAPAEELARRLVDLAPPGLTRVFLTTSGSSAIEAALKLVRRFWRLHGRSERRLVACLRDSFHGTGFGAMAVTGEDLGQGEYLVDRHDVLLVDTPMSEADTTLAQLEAHADQLAAVIVEPVLGSAGVVELAPDFLSGLQTLCRRRDVLLIADEVATGFGRTGSWFAVEQLGLHPDVLVLSKAINSGYLPLGAAVVSERIYRAFDDADAVFCHGETQAGNPLACAAANATIDVIREERLPARAAQLGATLIDRLREACAEAGVGTVSGRGLMIGLHVTDPGPIEYVLDLADQFVAEGVLAHPSPRGISLFPPLILTDDEAGEIVAATRAVLHRLPRTA
jgi:adenosylmethionine-8-amino-7-oxononanoate aminotransferase